MTLPTDLKEEMMKRFLAVCMVVVLMLSVFSGCSKEESTQGTEVASDNTKEEAKEEVTVAATEEVKDEAEESSLIGEIEFMTGTSIDSALFIAYEEITKRFMEENPGVNVELLPSSTDHEGEVKTRLASDNAPDIWMTHGWSVGRYGEFLEPLNDRVWAKDLNPALNSVMLDKDGTLYAFPIDLDIAGILYNSKVLDSVGVKPEDIKTWDDFYAVCDKVLAKGIVPIYTAGKDRWPTGLFIDWIGPGAFTDADLDGLMSGTFAKESWGKTLGVVEQFRDKGYINKDYASATSNDVSLALATEQAAFSFLMNFVAVESYNLNPDAAVGFMACPSFDANGKPFLITGEKNALGVSKTSESKEAALAYIDYLATTDNLAKLVATTGSACGLTTVTADLGGLTSSFELTKVVATVPYFDRVFMPSGSWDSIVATTDGVVTGQMSIEDALSKMETDYMSLFEKAKQGN